MTLMKLAGGTAALGLAAVGALHAVWTFSPWPLASRADFARTVVGVAEADAPGPGLTAAVAAALGTAGFLVAAQAGLAPRVLPTRLGTLATWAIAGGLLLRGGAGLATSALAKPTDYTRWDLVAYSPLCLTLGALTAYIATSATKQGQP
ncbi:hypothetical protein GCM10010404_79490 [Nonomuraea africana]